MINLNQNYQAAELLTEYVLDSVGSGIMEVESLL